MSAKTVLVCLGCNRPPVTFNISEGGKSDLLKVKASIVDTFADVLDSTSEDSLLLQVY